MMAIHSTAIVHNGAEIDHTSEVGPYSVIGPNVKIGKNNRIFSHVVIDGDTQIGDENLIYPFASVGGEPQDLKYKGEKTKLIIGNKNTVREYVTLNLGTVTGTGITKIGNQNLFMAYCHVGHDCEIGNFNVFANTTNLAGHAIVHDYVVFGGACFIAQFAKIGSHAYLGGGSFVERDVVPYSTGFGNRFRVKSINIVGLKRRGYSKDQIRRVLDAHKIIYEMGLTKENYMKKLDEEFKKFPEVEMMIDFIRTSEKGICLGFDDSESNFTE